MSRSNPTAQGQPHPCTRWFEWDSDNACIKYWDKDKKAADGTQGERVAVKLPFVFILLDKLATVKGYSEKEKNGIFSNEVRDTTREPLRVRFHGGRTIAEGFYKEIKDTVNFAGGKFTANLYLGYRDGDKLRIGSLQLKGAGLMGWMDFEKKHRDSLYTKAVKIATFTKGKTGKVDWTAPVFEPLDLKPETDTQAKELDKELQTYLDAYLKRNVGEQQSQQQEQQPARGEDPVPRDQDTDNPPLEGDDVPF